MLRKVGKSRYAAFNEVFSARVNPAFLA